MTFGIDISTHQATLDIAAAKAAGAEFVIVKAVASYRPELTVADDYHNNTDRTIAAGLGHAKGHYAVPNSRNTPQATAQFQFANRYRPAATDVYMLDNEPLDTYKVFWRDDDVAAYFEEMHRLGIRYSQMWLYCPAYLTRSSGPWPKIETLRKLGLKIVWVSYGDNDPYREDGEEPLLGGGITGWDVHQFTSTWRVPGYGGNVDGNYSPHTVGVLFGGSTMTLESKAREFAARYPTPLASPSPSTDTTWDQNCGIAMFQFGSFLGWSSTPGGDIRSAKRAYLGSHIEGMNPDDAPIGAYHWWEIGGIENGHVAQQVDTNTLVFMGSAKVWEDLGVDIGFGSVADYNSKSPDARYLGWSRDYSGGRPNLSATAGTGYEEIDMPLDANDKTWLNGLGASIIQQILGYGEGGANGAPKPATLGDQVNRIRNDIGHIHEVSPYSLKAIRTAQSSGGIDVDALAAKIAALIDIPAGSGLTEAQVEAAVRRVFADAAS